MQGLKKEKEILSKWQLSPILFIRDMWGLIPQVVREDCVDVVFEAIDRGRPQEFLPEYFEPFEKGKNFTWQQWQALIGVELALAGKKPMRISIGSGHGTGKSALLSWLIIWYLFCFRGAQVPCTAPSAAQMHDVLWKELQKWKERMPEEYRGFFAWTSGYFRVVGAEETWFARARTARPENPEALAGIHGDHVMMVIDEASGVAESVYQTAEGALTGTNTLVVMASNCTRSDGYFYDSHNKEGENINWQRFNFSSEESPIVEEGYCERMAQKYGVDSDEYMIRVKGNFPREGIMGQDGFIQLLSRQNVRFTFDRFMKPPYFLGVDPAGEGSNKSVWVLRNPFKAIVLAEENISNPKDGAAKTIAIMDQYSLSQTDVFVDGFGEGAYWCQELAGRGFMVNAVNTGDSIPVEFVEEKEMYLNLRARIYWELKTWLQSGGELVSNKTLEEQAFLIKYRRQDRGKIQIQSKKDMMKAGIASPDHMDALSLTFVEQLFAPTVGELVPDMPTKEEKYSCI